jgi:GTPase SAR1 family protein
LRKQGDIPFVVIGNKDDIEGKQEVTLEEGTNFAFSVNSRLFITSAKSGANVDLAFKQVELDAVESFKQSTPDLVHPMVPLDPDAESGARGDCC